MHIENNPFQQFNAPAGSLITQEVIMDKDFKTVFLLKEDTKYINRYPNKLNMELRVGLIKINNVFLVPIMMLINNDFEMLYETYYNYHAEGNANIINLLQQQEDLFIIFFNEKNDMVRQVKFKNDIKEDSVELTMRLKSTKAWSMGEFDVAKALMYTKFPTPQILWNSLTSMKY